MTLILYLLEKGASFFRSNPIVYWRIIYAIWMIFMASILITIVIVLYKIYNHTL